MIRHHYILFCAAAGGALLGLWSGCSRHPAKLLDEAAPCYQPQPIPCGPDAMTGSNYLVAVAQPFYLRHWLEPFLASSEAQAPWKDDAVRLLKEESFGLAHGWRGAMADIRAQTPPLIDKGCAYPALRWMYAMHLEKQNRKDEALKLMAGLNAEATTNAAWPSPLRALAAYGVMRMASNETSEAHLIDALFTTLTDGSFKTNETRVAWDFFEVCGMQKNPQLLARLLEADGTRIDPWFALMMRGQRAYDQAWEARGGGYADTVTEEGWAGFRDAMKEAHGLLTRAWELHPEFPDAAVLMIDCVRGDRSACRKWFDRAVAAQLDALPAYSSYRFTLRPRWGGSLREMEAFAEECLNTRRFDTKVPLQYVSCLFNMADEAKDDWQALFQKPGVYDNCKMILESDLARTFGTNSVGNNYYNTALAYTAYAAGDYDTAWRARAKLRNPDGRYGFDRRVRPPPPFHDIAITLISGMNGPNQAAMRQADRLARNGNAGAALAALETLAESKKLTGDEADAAAYWEVELGKRLACEKGEWFSLIRPRSTRFLDGPWISYNNSWRFSNQTFRTESKNGLLGATVAMPREVEYELTFRPIQADAQSPCHFGFALDSKPGTTVEGPVLWLAREKGAWTSCWMRRFGPDARSSRALSEVTPLKLGATDAIHVAVASRNDRVTAVVNGQTVCDKLDFSDLFYDRLRSGRLPYLFGSSVILTEWRMRQTGARPSPSAAAGIPVEKDDSPAESKP